MFQINAPFGGRLFEGAFILKILKRGGGVYSRGAFKRRGAFNRSNTVDDFFLYQNINSKVGRINLNKENEIKFDKNVNNCK